ncbi:hypothetical protein C2845_PM05G25490 [Panicum miliaceum]|uniref:Uncharacterized protein n=1 Tax=Panicum miliaceum TaxID=4540 RepID=A0A3L6SYU5_PANMI|nr:hypothetical protein C2845_PM05G25490 [Panicum miliaceum]
MFSIATRNNLWDRKQMQCMRQGSERDRGHALKTSVPPSLIPPSRSPNQFNPPRLGNYYVQCTRRRRWDGGAGELVCACLGGRGGVARPGLGGAREAGGDGGVVHGVVEGLRLRHARPQLPRLLLRQTTHERPAPLGGLLRRVGRGRWGLDVVGLARPPQQRRPPLAGLRRPAARADHPGACRGGAGPDGRAARRAGRERDGA